MNPFAAYSAEVPSYLKGQGAEALIAELLCEQGWHLVARNFRARGCELDLVVTKASCLSFIEVKYRRAFPQNPTEVDLGLTLQKKRSLTKGSQSFFQKHPAYYQYKTWRFDLAFVTPKRVDQRVAEIHYFVGAFDPYPILSEA